LNIARIEKHFFGDLRENNGLEKEYRSFFHCNHSFPL